MSSVRDVFGVLLTCSVLLCQHNGAFSMSSFEKRLYKEKVVEMFNHAYRSYMNYAYPADELMPLSCRGRVRGLENSRGDIDYTLGQFSLTLIDTLDTLAVIGGIDDFASAVRMVIQDTRFDSDLVVSVFETNIRVLGGLLGGHFAAVALKAQGHRQLSWYNDQLLTMAVEVGNRLLPAFNTTTGLPFPKINLRRGMGFQNMEKTTCTACAGSMILEFAALSRLTGDPQFEVKAHQAMEMIWRSRSRGYNLVGSVINVHSGEWARVESGVGAGIDSYYEYCLKSYILLGDKEYLRRFGLHYKAIKRYITNGPMLVDVSMNAPHRMTRSFMDSLLAFWPGLQVLWGDIDTAIHIHDMLYHVTERHNFLPEAFTHDFRLHWANHPLRPEFIESTYYLYKATGDPYYLDVGRTVVNNLDRYARVRCGFAAIENLEKKTHEDRMDSFVLAETFKYLYLLFAEEGDSPLDMEDFVFTTEAHLFPLSLANANATLNKVVRDTLLVMNSAPENNTKENAPSVVISAHLTCPNNRRPFVLLDMFEKMVYRQCTTSRFNKRPAHPKRKRLTPPRLSIDSLDFKNSMHVKILSELGIVVEPIKGEMDRVKISHIMAKALTPEDAEEGWYLMQDIMKMMNQQSQLGERNPRQKPKLVRILSPTNLKERGIKHEFVVGPALFGPVLGVRQLQLGGSLVRVGPHSEELGNGCSEYSHEEAEEIKGKILLVMRGGCMFILKVRMAQKAGAAGVIISDNVDSYNTTQSPPFSMSGDDSQDITIPSVFMQKTDANLIRELLSQELVQVQLTWFPEEPSNNTGQQTTSSTEDRTEALKDQLYDDGQSSP